MLRLLPLLLVATLISCWPRFAGATAQSPDLLLYRGDTLLLHSNPLEKWLDMQAERPKEVKGNGATNCWRGYVATWLLENERLYLMKVQPCGGPPLAVAVLQQWFPHDDPHRVAATWVTSQLNVVKGKLVSYEHMGYGSIYEQNWLLTMSAGKLVGEQLFNTIGCETDEPPGGARAFFQEVSQAIAWDRVPTMKKNDPRRRVFLELRPDSTGHRCHVRLVKSAGTPYDSLAIAAVRTAAARDWGVCYQFGRWKPIVWTMPVVFDEANRRRAQARQRQQRR